jgi:uncharacterized protein YndB with AHSA1/START domain
MATVSPSQAPGVLEVRRTFNARRDRVFAAWSSAAALKRWHAPTDAVAEDAEVDFRVGGRYYVVMRGNDGSAHRVDGEYREIEPPTRIVLTWQWQHAPDLTSLVTVQFIERGDQTEVVLTHAGLPTEQQRDAHRQGWVGCFDNLAKVV